MKNEKKLLVIGYVWPEPNSSAAGARILQLIQCFQLQGYQVTYSSPAAPSDHAIHYQDYNINPVTIELNHSSFDQFIQNLQPDAVLFDRFMMEEQFGWRVEKQCPNALRLLDTEDLHCLRQARQSLAKGNSKVIKNVPTHTLFSDIAKREIAAIYRCDLTFMISQYEMDLLKNAFLIPESILMYTPFMIEPKQQARLSFGEREHFISIGNFRHEPNWDAVLQLKQHIWPLIKKQLPKAELYVYGAYPPKKATQLHNEKQGFYVKGWCEDAYHELQQARVLLAPLRFGAGLKGKIVDAAQCSLPAITTSIGAEGLESEPDRNPFEVADNFTQFADKACELYQDEIRWNNLHQNGSSFIELFDVKLWQNNVKIRIQSLSQNLEDHRICNFTGSMLRHHTMKSTQYMAQWIEAKNKT